MKQVLVLGGAGNQAAYAVEKMVADDLFDELVIADFNKAAADAVVARLGSPKVRAVQVDVFDRDALVGLMNAATVVANCTGPYYRLLVPVMDALLLSSCRNYVDLCDDVEVMEAVMSSERQALARERGLRAIVGLGGSPGLIPVEIMFAASLMDDVDSVKLYMLIDELDEGGPAVWDHMLENFAGEISVWKDGRAQVERGLVESVEYDFDEDVFPGAGRVRLYTLGHPEAFTLPRVLPGLREIDIKTSYWPPFVQDVIVTLDRMGMLATEPVSVGGVEVSPRAVLIQSMMANIFGDPSVQGGWHPSRREPEDFISGPAIEVRGTKDGAAVLYKSSFNSTTGSVTGYPLAVGVAMLLRGDVERTGIMIAEEAITKTREFVDEVYGSIEAAGHPLRRKAEVIYELATAKETTPA